MVDLCLIDSGDQTDEVYEFCALNAEWALPCKGVSAQLSHYRLSTVNKTGSRAYGMNLVLVDGGKYKDMIASRLRKPNGKGSWMVYRGCDEEYAKQVTAEHKVAVKNGKGQTTLVWQPKSGNAGADNHYLDCEVYCMAAADVKGVRQLFLQTEVEPPKQAAETTPTPEENWIRANDNWI
jgi:phage terminase large subunit GpA-like protein